MKSARISKGKNEWFIKLTIKGTYVKKFIDKIIDNVSFKVLGIRAE